MASKETLKPEQESRPDKNPNTIGELISFGKDLLTSPDKVYRNVGTKTAIDDIETSGVVRNKQSAGLVEKSRWGERVFWSKGATDRYHPVSQNSYVIVAPLAVAEERAVTKDDVEAIYTKNESGEVVDILGQRRENDAIERQKIIEQKQAEDAQKIADIQKSLDAVK